MMNCGYDPAPDGKYDLPPIAPQMWHAYHIAGEQLTMAIVAALLYRWRTGQGQQLSCAIHEAVAKSTEVDLMSWVMRRAPILRQTCRHAREIGRPAPFHRAHQGRPLGHGEPRQRAPARGRGSSRCSRATAWPPISTAEETAAPQGGRFVPGTRTESAQRVPHDGGLPALRARLHLREHSVARGPGGGACSGRRCASRTRTRSIPHWLARKSVADVEHPELGRVVPLRHEQVAQHRHRLVGGPARAAAERRRCDGDDARERPTCRLSTQPRAPEGEALSRRGKPFPLHGIRILDFTWFLASAGRHAVPERVRRRKHQGGTEEPSRHAASPPWRRSAVAKRARRRRRRCPA